jgi:hypothetical protein
MSRGSRERRMRRLRNGQLYSAGLTRLGIAALLGVRWDHHTLIGRFKGRVVRDVSYQQPAGLRPCITGGLPGPYRSLEFGRSSASSCDKGSAGMRLGRRSPQKASGMG